MKRSVPMKTYVIDLLNSDLSDCESFQTDNPRTAVRKFFKYYKKSPGLCMISCGSKSSVEEIYKAFIDDFVNLLDKYAEDCDKDVYIYLLYAHRNLYNQLLKYNKLVVEDFCGTCVCYDQVPLFSLS